MSIAASPMITQHVPPLDDADLTVANAVWIATALLQREAGDSRVFSTEKIVQSVEELRLTKGVSKSIWQHVNQHCVANRPPQPNRACMLTATGRGNRRLFREGDKVDDGRRGGRTHPDWEKLPTQFQSLKDWYEKVWNAPSSEEDPLLAAIGAGREIWADQHADEYIAELRDWRME
ncbi:MAG TPA: hypothetical protein VN678_13170 [Acidobacteriaceae bacterium]|nr:hypothetical protein [Acidobacteriaceae bacterium]